MSFIQDTVNWIVGRTEPVKEQLISDLTFGGKFNPYQADRVSVATTCVKILAESVGKLPAEILRDQDGKGKMRDTDFYLYKLLHEQPNPWTTANTFFQTLEYHRNFKGNAFAKIHRNAATGRVEWLEIITPSRVKGYKLEKGQLYYSIKSEDDRKDDELVNANDILHFRMMSPDGIWGINPIEALRMNMSVTFQGLNTMDSFYENNLFSPKAIKSSVAGAANKKLMDEAVDEISKKFSGAGKAGKLIPLPANTEIQDLQINLQDAQIIESMKFNSQQISALYGVPVFMATGDYTQSKFNSIEQMSIGFKVNTIQPITRMYKAEIESKLLTDADKYQARREFMFDLNSLVEADLRSKGDWFKSLFNMAAISPEEIAKRNGLPTEGLSSDTWAPTNTMSVPVYYEKNKNTNNNE